MRNNTEKYIPPHILAIRLRALISALGESSNPAWWKTEFMNETGLRFLERLYPRTFVRAAVHAAGRAACEIHDRTVGRVGVYHLFRFPESLEVEMHKTAPSEDDDFFKRFKSCLGQQDNLMEMLAPHCNDMGLKADAGPKRIGTASDVTTIDGLVTAASVYRNAFKQGKHAFPYFADEQNRIVGRLRT